MTCLIYSLLEAVHVSASTIVYVKYNLRSFGRDPPSLYRQFNWFVNLRDNPTGF